MARHELDAVRAAVTGCRDAGFGKHGPFANSGIGLSVIRDRWQRVETAITNNTQTDGSHDLTRRLLQMGGLIMKFVEQFGCDPLPTILEAKPTQPTPDTDPEPKGSTRT